jgi:hypothetical protein
MIYIYNVELLASLRNRSLSSYSEYNILDRLLNPATTRMNVATAGLPGMFYFYIHEIYDPLFLWNITEIRQLRIELGNNRFIGRALKLQQTSEELWLPTLLISPVPWDFTLADIQVKSLDKTINIDFPNAERFDNSPASVVIHGDFFNEVIRPYLKFPKIYDKFFGVNDDATYKKYSEDNLSYSYILKNKKTIIGVLGKEDNPAVKEYDINNYAGVVDTLSAMFAEAEKEIK